MSNYVQASPLKKGQQAWEMAKTRQADLEKGMKKHMLDFITSKGKESQGWLDAEAYKQGLDLPEKFIENNRLAYLTLDNYKKKEDELVRAGFDDDKLKEWQREKQEMIEWSLGRVNAFMFKQNHRIYLEAIGLATDEAVRFIEDGMQNHHGYRTKEFLEGQYQVHQRERSEWDTQKAEYERVVDSRLQQARNLHAQNASLQTQLNQRIQERVVMARELERLTNENQTLRNQIESLNQRIEGFENSFELLMQDPESSSNIVPPQP